MLGIDEVVHNLLYMLKSDDFVNIDGALMTWVKQQLLVKKYPTPYINHLINNRLDMDLREFVMEFMKTARVLTYNIC